MLKKILVSFVFVGIFISFVAKADIQVPKPIFFQRDFIKLFDENYRNKPIVVSNGTGNEKPIFKITSASLHNTFSYNNFSVLDLGNNLQKLPQDLYQKKNDLNVKKESNMKDDNRNTPNIYKGFYVIDKNEIIVGNVLLENWDITEYINEPKSPPVQEIFNLNKNPNYLKNKLKLPPNSSITVYEREIGGYYERYGIEDINGKKIFILQSFYPKEMESFFENKIANTINKFADVVYKKLEEAEDIDD
ncbi:MAG: hypothetical protein AABZ74_11700 [Cyanobacteriota bacterium]